MGAGVDPKPLLAGMLDRTLFVARSYLLAAPDSLGGHLGAHLEFMIALEKEGVLFASGPFFEDGKGTGEGMTIVRAASLADARAILEKDPFVVAGLRRFELHEWHLMEGSIQVTVLASQQRGVLP